MEKTEAASVEPSTAPMSMPSSQPVCRANRQNTPIAAAVRNTPKVDSSTAFSGNWFCRTPFGAESAVKMIKIRGNGTEGFRQGVVVETDMQRTVHAAEHTHGKKCQQHGHADLTGQLVAENTGDHH